MGYLVVGRVGLWYERSQVDLSYARDFKDFKWFPKFEFCI